MIPLTVWMNHPSFYQSDLFRSLVKTERVDLHVIYSRDLPDGRKILGWHTDVEGYVYQFLNQSNQVLNAIAIARKQRHRMHLINGVWAEPAFAAALATLALSNAVYAIYSEAANPSIPRTIAKRITRRILSSAVLPWARGVFPVSHMGAQFFRSLGVNDERLYPFGYFRSGLCTEHEQAEVIEADAVEVIFVGQIIYRKGLDLLLEAMYPLFGQYHSLKLVLVGSGDLSSQLQAQVRQLGLEERVMFEGVLSPTDIPTRIAKADVLVLPSRWDGWGVVVNEALSVGVPVIVSDRCGAADLVQSGVNGYVFRSEDVADLRACLTSFFARKADWLNIRASAAETGSRISTDNIAWYLVECLEHMVGMRNIYPIAPWMHDSRAFCETAATTQPSSTV